LTVCRGDILNAGFGPRGSTKIGLFARALMPVRPNRCPGDRCLWRNTQDLPTLALAGQPLPPRRELALRLEVVTKR
jgi:hypothetical protein